MSAAGAAPRIITLLPCTDGIAVESDDGAAQITIRSEPGKLIVIHYGSVDEGVSHVAGSRASIFCRGRAEDFTVVPIAQALAVSERAERSTESHVISAMPGRITSVEVSVGQKVRKGDTVIVMEAMKLILSLVAPADGTVSAIHCAPGQTVTGGVRLVEFASVAVEAPARSAASS